MVKHVRTLFFVAVAVFLTPGVSLAAIIFSGGGSTNLTMTLTEDLRIPLTAGLSGTSKIGFVLKDVYSINQGFSLSSAAGYGAPGSITGAVELSGGGTNEGLSYSSLGVHTATFGVIGPRTFIVEFGTTNSAAAAGDVLVIRAGSLTTFNNPAAPDLISGATVIQAFDNTGPGNPISDEFTVDAVTVPEPAGAVLFLCGSLAALTLGRRHSNP